MKGARRCVALVSWNFYQHSGCSLKQCCKAQLYLCFYHLRVSKWQETAFGTLLPTTPDARCHQKVSQDFVFANVIWGRERVEVSLMETKYSFVDMMGIFGKDNCTETLIVNFS